LTSHPEQAERADHPRPGGLEARIERAIAALYRWFDRNRFTRIPWAMIQTFSQAQGALLSGSMAYYTFLSLLPLLLVAGFVLATVSHSNPSIQSALVGAIERIFPGVQGREVLNQLVRSRFAFGAFGVIALAYGASGFVGALTACLNRMWAVATGRNPVGQKLLNLGVVVLLGLVLLGSVGLTLWATYLAQRVLGGHAGAVPSIVDALASPLSLFLVLLLVYRLLPARKLTWRGQLPGAVFCAIGTEALKRAFAFWTEHSTGVAALPRSMLSAVLLLVWLGFFGQLILYGAALNVVRDRVRRGLTPNPRPQPGRPALEPEGEL
jgi:YihY family inner membrane protein